MENSNIYKKYLEKTLIISDIYEHLPTLYKYGKLCNNITECGTRNVVSSYAFASSLLNNKNNNLVIIDISMNNNIINFIKECKDENINIKYYNDSDLVCKLDYTDLLFIDTFHVYGHLKRELERWHKYVNKYIILHDTTIDEYTSELVRHNIDINSVTSKYNMTYDELYIGLWPAVENFLENNKEWKIKERYVNNNGLTILEKY